MDAIAEDDPQQFDEALPPVLKRFDTPVNRAALARSVLGLVEAGEIDEDLAAVAIFDLTNPETSALLGASLIQTLSLAVGKAQTPAGLIVQPSHSLAV